MNTNSDLIKLIIQSIKNDLNSRNPIHVNLALQCIANIGSKEMAEAFGNEIPKLLVSGYDVMYLLLCTDVLVAYIRFQSSNIRSTEILWTS